MTVGELKKLLEEVKPDLEVMVWNHVDEVYTEATYANIEELFKLEKGEHVYDEDGDPVMFEAFSITD